MHRICAPASPFLSSRTRIRMHAKPPPPSPTQDVKRALPASDPERSRRAHLKAKPVLVVVGGAVARRPASTILTASPHPRPARPCVLAVARARCALSPSRSYAPRYGLTCSLAGAPARFAFSSPQYPHSPCPRRRGPRLIPPGAARTDRQSGVRSRHSFLNQSALNDLCRKSNCQARRST